MLSPARHAAGQTPTSPKREYRAVWLTTINGLDWPRTKAATPQAEEIQKGELCALLDSLQALNMNTVLLQTRIRGDVIYPSEIEPFNAVFAGKTGKAPGYDPLSFAIEECHKRGLQLHAWMVMLPLGNLQQTAAQGKRSLTKRRPDLCRLYQSAWYMEPGNPETLLYLEELVREVVTRYDVDGIHFDYIRYPDRTNSYPDRALYRKSGRGQGVSQWRRENITALVRRLYGTVKAEKPWVCVSCAPLGKYSDTPRYSSLGWNAYHTVFQEAQEWLKEGIMDAVFPMLYFKDNHFYPFAIDWAENAYGRSVAPGIGIYQMAPEERNWDLNDIVRELYVTRQYGLQGQNLFRASFLCRNTKQILPFIRQFYAFPALTPALVWCDSVPPDAPQNLRMEVSGKSYCLTWDKAEKRAESERVRYNIYASRIFPVEISDASLLQSAAQRENVFQYPISGTPLHFAITAIDRYGNESRPLQWENRLVTIRPSFFEFPPMEEKPGYMTLYDVWGRPLKKMRFAPRVNLNKLPKGCYCIRAYASKGKCLGSYPVIH